MTKSSWRQTYVSHFTPIDPTLSSSSPIGRRKSDFRHSPQTIVKGGGRHRFSTQNQPPYGVWLMMPRCTSKGPIMVTLCPGLLPVVSFCDGFTHRLATQISRQGQTDELRKGFDLYLPATASIISLGDGLPAHTMSCDLLRLRPRWCLFRWCGDSIFQWQGVFSHQKYIETVKTGLSGLYLN